LVNGRVYVTDDRGGMYEYNPTTDKWAKKAGSGFDKRSTPLSAVNGKVYAIGGITVADNVFLSVVQEYNPITDTWTRKKDLPFPLAWPSACTVGDKIYVFGGWSGVGIITVPTVMEYDPSADEWTKKADMPTGRGFLPKSAPVINGKVYVIGGYQNTALSVTEIYDLKTDTWTKGSDMPTPRFALSTTAAKGKIYTFGGCLGANVVAQTWTKTVEVYDTGETFPVRAYRKLTTTWAALKK
jgi:N-acetylneuraminic acid mutarotase